MKLTRMSGAGNTFYVCDQATIETGVRPEQRSQFAKNICHMFEKAPTDGFLILEKHDVCDFKWDFYNSDGSAAEMCGNAARCAGLYLKESTNKTEALRFLTGAGPVAVSTIENETFSVQMPVVKGMQAKIDGHFFVNSGVPHIVVESYPNLNLAKLLRPKPAPNGANVTFVYEAQTLQGLSEAKAVTFERGVEGWTRACGTGAVAAGVFLHFKYGSTRAVIDMPGGKLEVLYSGGETSPRLIGAAQVDYLLEIGDEEVHHLIQERI